MPSNFRVRPNGSQSHFIFYFVKYRQSLVCSGTFVIGQCHLPVPGMWNRVGVKLIPNWRGGEPTFRRSEAKKHCHGSVSGSSQNRGGVPGTVPKVKSATLPRVK